MASKRTQRSDLVRLLAVCLAILSLLFVAQALNHSHTKGQNEAACHVCQAAHIGGAPKTLAPTLFSPLLAIGFVPPFVVTIHQELFSHDSPSRAPPAA
jgi:cytochrome c5